MIVKSLAAQELVPVYYDGQDQDGPPAFYETRAQVRERKKAGDGCFQRNGTIYVIFGPPDVDYETIPAGSDFRSSWHTKQSGLAGPIVWQLRPQPATQ